MQGQLRDHPLAELIHEITTNKLNGVVRVERERVKAAIYAAAGRVVLASSNLRSQRLLELLRRWNALDAQGWHKTETLLALPAAASDAGLADLLVRQGVLPASAIGNLQARQTEEILRPLLLWRDGAWNFDARVRLADENHVAIDEKRFLLEAARSMPPEFVAARFADPAEIIRPMRAAETGVALQQAEAFLLSRVVEPTPFGVLMQISSLPLQQACAALYALVLAGFVARDRPPRAFTAEAVARQRAEQQAAPGKTAAEANLRATVIETDEEKMKALLARGEANNHYAVLGISHNAPLDRIKSAYYALAKRFHPDMFDREKTPPEVRARIEAAFAIIANAYDALKNSEARARYDLQLLNRNPTPVVMAQPTPPEVETTRPTAAPQRHAVSPASLAEASFQEAVRAEKDKNFVLALTRAAEAARLVPQEARYRAQYGRLLAADRSNRRHAEAELLAAVNLSNGDATFRLMLAEFYRDVGLRRRAIGEVERALQSQPENARARQLHKELQRGA